MPLVQEVGDHELVKRGGKTIEQHPHRPDGRHQLRWDHQIAQPKTGQQRLAEGAEIDDPLVLVDALQRR